MSQVVQPQQQASVTAPEGTPKWVRNVMAGIFYAGLTIYLLGSIDHVAWFFHLYEPQNQIEDWWTMTPSYGKAGALDLTIFFLAYVAATGKTADKVTTWFFTILLSLVSLYANYLYAMFFNPVHQSDIWNIQILGGLTTTGWLSPIIASSYPIFAIIFMYLIERVVSRKVETPEEMQARLNALIARKALEKQIKAAEGPGLIERAKQTAIEAKTAAAEVLKKEQKPAQTLPQNTPLLLPDQNEDKLILTLKTLEQNTNITDKALAEILNLKRAASARFWRLKAIEILQNNGSIFHQPTPAPDQQNTSKFDQEQAEDTNEEVNTGDLAENDEKQPITDPEIEAVELPQDDTEDKQENNASDPSSQARQEGKQEMQNNASQTKQDSPKKELKGMLYRVAAKLEICQQKKITAADIRSAVRSKSLRTYTDGSVSKSAVESWAKTFHKVDEKVEATSAA